MSIHSSLPGNPAISHHPGHNLQLKHQATGSGHILQHSTRKYIVWSHNRFVGPENLFGDYGELSIEMSMQELHLKFPNSGLLHAFGKVQ